MNSNISTVNRFECIGKVFKYEYSISIQMYKTPPSNISIVYRFEYREKPSKIRGMCGHKMSNAINLVRKIMNENTVTQESGFSMGNYYHQPR